VKVIVGLGNPGKKYRKTPHNVGFEVIDEISSRVACSLRRSLRVKAMMGRGVFEGEDLLLVKPTAYMNRSGPVVAQVMRRGGIKPQDLVVVLDDADLEFGRLRLRPKGSSGGHRGLGSIVEAVGSSDFVRVRIGIGRTATGGSLVEHVLSPFSGKERKRMAAVIGTAADAVMSVLESGVGEAMNRFNGPVQMDA